MTTYIPNAGPGRYRCAACQSTIASEYVATDVATYCLSCFNVARLANVATIARRPRVGDLVLTGQRTRVWEVERVYRDGPSPRIAFYSATALDRPGMPNTFRPDEVTVVAAEDAARIRTGVEDESAQCYQCGDYGPHVVHPIPNGWPGALCPACHANPKESIR